MNIKLVSAHINNFKNMNDYRINFSDVTNIMGENGVGKTTVYDGVSWVLCGKDSKDRKDFEIKPLTKSGKAIHGVETSVELSLLVDSRIVILKKIYREKWTKKRGEAKRQFTGHETLYYVNDVPLSLKEYNEKVNEIITEDMFKILSSPYYFSSINWREQMKMLLEVAGNVKNEDVIKKNIKLLPLTEPLRTYLVDDFKKSLMGKGRKTKRELEAIPHRIDECNGQIFKGNFLLLEKRREEITKKREDIKELLLNEAKRKSLEDLKAKSYRKELLKEEEERAIRDREYIRELDFEIAENQGKLNVIRSLKNDKTNVIARINEERSSLLGKVDFLAKKELELRESFRVENEREFRGGFKDESCPTCLRPFDEKYKAKKLQDLRVRFEDEKDKAIEAINIEGRAAVQDRKKLLDEIGKREEKKLLYLKALKDLEEDERQQRIFVDELIAKEKSFFNLQKVSVFSDENSKIRKGAFDDIDREDESLRFGDVLKEDQALECELFEVNSALEKRDVNLKLQGRIEELTLRERELSENLAGTERLEFLCEEFVKTKVSMLEESINERFENVRFKLFHEQVNGGVSECCECTYDGVPYSNLNTGSQINTGLEIVKALSRHYGVFAPVFIDNRESVNSVVNGFGQMINLIVSRDKVLLVCDGDRKIVEKYQNNGDCSSGVDKHQDIFDCNSGVDKHQNAFDCNSGVDKQQDAIKDNVVDKHQDAFKNNGMDKPQGGSNCNSRVDKHQNELKNNVVDKHQDSFDCSTGVDKHQDAIKNNVVDKHQDAFDCSSRLDKPQGSSNCSSGVDKHQNELENNVVEKHQDAFDCSSRVDKHQDELKDNGVDKHRNELKDNVVDKHQDIFDCSTGVDKHQDILNNKGEDKPQLEENIGKTNEEKAKKTKRQRKVEF